MIAVVDISRQAGRSVSSRSRADLITTLTARLSWPPGKVAHVIDQLTMTSRESFLVPAAPHKPSDVYPWKFGRRLSYLRRPFLSIDVMGEQKLMWGMRHMFHSAGYLVTICLEGRLQARTVEMRSAMAELNDERGTHFNNSIAELLARDGRIVEARKSKFGDLRMPKDLGDIDVLVVEKVNRRIAVIECKDLALARTPQELSNQLEGLTRGTVPSQGAATTRHARRVKWVHDNLPNLLAHFGIGDVEDWQVKGMLVVDEPLFASHLRNIGMEVRSQEALRANRDPFD